ncbi:MAG TPA: DUF4412 domain-containing protein [Thermoanaerobaculia bacterium]|nr:DUF4412 domain-containing protein [Thermoanaerobaculia bacterium]
MHAVQRFPLPALALALAGTLSIFATATAEEITVVSTMESSMGKASASTSTTYMGKNKLRTVEGDTEVMVDYTTGEMTFLDTKKKTYWTTSPAELEAKFAELSQALEGMPMMDKIFGTAGEVEVTELGTTQQVAGYTCRDYRISMGDAYVFELCATRDLKPPADVHAARRLMFANMGPMAGKIGKLFDEMSKIEGLPLVSDFTMSLMGRTMTTETRATAVEVGPIPDERFAIPAGFKQKKSPFE